MKARGWFLSLTLVFAAHAAAQIASNEQYDKYEYMIPMRDGVRLCTTVYVPKNKPGEKPIMLQRTPYSAGPYGERMKPSHPGSQKFKDAGYIYAYQDVRGRYMSEGEFVHMRPQLQVKWLPHDVDESTDTYDTVEFLIKNVPQNNQKVGIWGISYPGGYAALGAIDTHPALKAASPQAPTAEWFLGDDFHHNGVFFLQDAFSFLSGFDGPRNGPAPTNQRLFSFNIEGDAYKFFLNLGPIANTQKPEYFGGRSRWWNDMFRHGHYDEFWQARNVPNNMKNVKAAVMTVGGWYDAEDLYGPLNVYAKTEQFNPGITNILVMGPWPHGGWAGSRGGRLGHVDFSAASRHYLDNIEFPFFDHYLRGGPAHGLPEATMYDTGRAEFANFAVWPPKDVRATAYHFDANKALAAGPSGDGSDEYVSDPMNPAPYEGGTLRGRSRTYMLADQRFASERADVLTYRSPVLDRDVTWLGPVKAHLAFTTTSTDVDFVVKIVDVQPEGTKDPDGNDIGGAQMMVRGEIMRSKFRHSYSNPAPLTPGKREVVGFTLPDVFHTFKKGHRIMVQVQSAWFPLADRNPQTFTDIYSAGQDAFVKATIQMHRGANGSRIEVGTR